MALQLELSTAKASKALQNFDKALAQSQKKMQAFNNALNKAGTASSSFGSGLSKASQGLRNVSGAAGRAATATGAYANSARGAAGATKGLTGAMGLAKSTLLGFGVALGGMGLASLTKDVFQSVTAMQQLRGQLDAIAPGANTGQKGLEFVRKTARSTATDLDALTGSFKTFASNSLNSGLKMKEVEEVFEAIAISSRSMGLTTAQTKRTFMGFQQIVSKGSFSMEELRQQIGENISVLPLLAKSMNVTGGELQKMLANGEVGLENLLPLAKEMKKVYGPGLAAAMKTPLAAMTLLGNAWTRIKQLFGEPFFNALTPALNRFTESLEKAGKNGAEGMAAFGEMAGTLVGGAIDVIRILSENIDLVTAALIALGGYWVTVKTFKIAETLYGWGQAAAPAAQAMAQLAKNMTAMSTPASTLAPAIGANATALQKFGKAAGFVLNVLGRSVLILGLMAAAYAVTMVVMGKGEQLMKEVGAVLDWLLGLFGTNSKEVAAWAQEWYDYIAGLMDFSGVAKMIGDWINYIQEQYQKLDEAYSAMVNYVRQGLVDAWDAVKSAVASVIDTVNSYIDGAIATVKKWIAALKEALGLSSKASGSGGGNVSVPGARSGGISHRLSQTNASTRVPAAAFAGAPHFAKGGVTGPFGQSGIPAILHPNEAVIPLQNGAVPVSMKTDKSVEGRLAEAIDGNRELKKMVAEGGRKGESIDFNTKGLEEFIRFAESYTRQKRQKQAQAYDFAASTALMNAKATVAEKKYGGFTTKGKGMSGGSGKTYSVSTGDDPYGRAYGVDPKTGQTKDYGPNIPILTGGSYRNLVSVMDGRQVSQDYYNDIRPDFDYSGNTGLGWDVAPGLSMRHYKAAYGAAKMGVPIGMLPGARPGDMQHHYMKGQLSNKQSSAIGNQQMSHNAAANGLAMWLGMKKENPQGTTGWMRTAKSYRMGAKHAKNPPGMGTRKRISGTAVEKAVQRGMSLEDFLKRNNIKPQTRQVGGGYAPNPQYDAVAQAWAAAEAKYGEQIANRGRGMDAGSRISGDLGSKMKLISGSGYQHTAAASYDILGQASRATGYDPSGKNRGGFNNSISVKGGPRIGGGPFTSGGAAMAGSNTGIGGGGAMNSFMSGTANTSKDPRFMRAPSAGDGRGGRMVTIHPDEAVIPLRNGKVPIDMGNRAMGQGGGMTGGASARSGGGVTVNMTIQATDVESFRRNEKQIMQDMTIEMQRAANEIGTPTGEDLTKIRNAPPKRY